MRALGASPLAEASKFVDAASSGMTRLTIGVAKIRLRGFFQSSVTARYRRHASPFRPLKGSVVVFAGRDTRELVCAADSKAVTHAAPNACPLDRDDLSGRTRGRVSGGD